MPWLWSVRCAPAVFVCGLLVLLLHTAEAQPEAAGYGMWFQDYPSSGGRVISSSAHVTNDNGLLVASTIYFDTTRSEVSITKWRPDLSIEWSRSFAEQGFYLGAIRLLFNSQDNANYSVCGYRRPAAGGDATVDSFLLDHDGNFHSIGFPEGVYDDGSGCTRLAGGDVILAGTLQDPSIPLNCMLIRVGQKPFYREQSSHVSAYCWWIASRPVADGGYVLLGRANKLGSSSSVYYGVIQRYDADNRLVKTVVFPTSWDALVDQLTVLDDGRGHFLVSGSFTATCHGPCQGQVYEVALVHKDTLQPLWAKRGLPHKSSIHLDLGGRVLLVSAGVHTSGHYKPHPLSSAGNNYINMVCLDKGTGDLLWARRLQAPGGIEVTTHFIHQLADRFVLAASNTAEPIASVAVNMLWVTLDKDLTMVLGCNTSLEDVTHLTPLSALNVATGATAPTVLAPRSLTETRLGTGVWTSTNLNLSCACTSSSMNTSSCSPRPPRLRIVSADAVPGGMRICWQSDPLLTHAQVDVVATIQTNKYNFSSQQQPPPAPVRWSYAEPYPEVCRTLPVPASLGFVSIGLQMSDPSDKSSTVGWPATVGAVRALPCTPCGAHADSVNDSTLSASDTCTNETTACRPCVRCASMFSTPCTASSNRVCFSPDNVTAKDLHASPSGDPYVGSRDWRGMPAFVVQAKVFAIHAAAVILMATDPLQAAVGVFPMGSEMHVLAGQALASPRLTVAGIDAASVLLAATRSPLLSGNNCTAIQNDPPSSLLNITNSPDVSYLGVDPVAGGVELRFAGTVVIVAPQVLVDQGDLVGLALFARARHIEALDVLAHTPHSNRPENAQLLAQLLFVRSSLATAVTETSVINLSLLLSLLPDSFDVICRAFSAGWVH